MTKHPITPPPELVQQWLGTYFGATVTGEVSDVELALATQAARWGSDQELEACVNYIDNNMSGNKAREFRAIRRPKPPSLKEQALAVVENSAICDHLSPEHEAILRQALEQLDD